jgi:sugar transferase EpsL
MVMNTKINFNYIYRHFSKRILDVLLAITILLIIWPFLLIIYTLLRISIGPGVIFRHRRPGLRGESFIMYKFRTMTNEYDTIGNPLPDELRITKIGQLLRGLSLDELPEIFNVIKGDMSLVGPRPLLIEYLDRYSPEQARRHEVKPGITGWAQINGRNAITWELKFEFDVWYADHQSFIMDMKILAKTIIKVLRREGISEEGFVSASDFLGNGRNIALNDSNYDSR